MAMGIGKRVCLAGVAAGLLSGCASLEELRQTQMANRNLSAEKAALEQEMFDLRGGAQAMRARADALEDQVATKDRLISSLQSENETLDVGFKSAQTSLEKWAGMPFGDPASGIRLPAELDAALKAFAAEHAGSVVYDARQGTLKWTSDLLFALGSDVVKDSAAGGLRSFSEIMRSPVGQQFDIVVVGHTDDVPVNRPETKQRHPSNEHLAVHRSIAVKQHLVSGGMSPSRVGVMGYGQYKPVAPNDGDGNRSKNRRVEVYVVPAGAFSAGAESTHALSITGNEPTGVIK
ncbi:MAG: OmpA family protein [Phycisphaerales bacterium]|nr:OmpA family protein [Phycisphaerales bacterium]